MTGITGLLAIAGCGFWIAHHTRASLVHSGKPDTRFSVLVFAGLAIVVGCALEVLRHTSACFKCEPALKAPGELVPKTCLLEKLGSERIVSRDTSALHMEPPESNASEGIFLVTRLLQETRGLRKVLGYTFP